MTCVTYATYLKPHRVTQTTKHTTYSCSNTRSSSDFKSSTSSADNAPRAPTEPEAEFLTPGDVPEPRPLPTTDRGRDSISRLIPVPGPPWEEEDELVATARGRETDLRDRLAGDEPLSDASAAGSTTSASAARSTTSKASPTGAE